MELEEVGLRHETQQLRSEEVLQHTDKIDRRNSLMVFSERYGYKKIREIVQVDSIDNPLRNALWSILTVYVWDNIQHSIDMYGGCYLSNSDNAQIKSLCVFLWFKHFKEPLDQLDDEWGKVYPRLRKHFFDCEWYEVYDFIEFVANHYERDQFKENFIKTCNELLEKEVSAYRFIDGSISRVTGQQEVEEIELALECALGQVQSHLRRALELLSNRKTPDYRNSIKESICAVESLVVSVTGAEKGTLGQLIKKLENEIGLHPALKSAFSSLYGYTSDEGGIRHALLTPDNIRFEDAKFYLVVCSAFINFVKEKVAKVANLSH